MGQQPDLTGQAALVTGASRGIGRFLALSLARCGAAIAGTARSLDSSAGTGGTLRGTIADIEAMGGRALAVPGEITDPDDAGRIVGAAAAGLGRIDILVNNAGVFPAATVVDMPAGVWSEQIEINVNAVFYMCHHTLPVMLKQGNGCIINVSSYLADYYHPTHVGYSTTKAAVNRFSVNLAQEIEGSGVRVNSWAPGLTSTDMTSGKGEPVELLEESFIWLVSPAAAAISGTVAERREVGKSWGPIA